MPPGQLGEIARLAIPALMVRVNDPDNRVRVEVERELNMIRPNTNRLESCFERERELH